MFGFYQNDKLLKGKISNITPQHEVAGILK